MSIIDRKERNWLKDRSPLRLMVAILIVTLVLVGGYFGWQAWEKRASVTLGPVVSGPASLAGPGTPKDQSSPVVTAAETTDTEAERWDYTVKAGDSLSRLFPKQWREICELNALADCNVLKIGQVLRVPKATTVSTIVPRSVVRDKDGWLPIKRLNVDPYRKYRTPAKDRKILRERGYSESEIEEFFSKLAAGTCTEESFAKGTEFSWMSHGNAKITEKLRAVWDTPEPATVCQLSSGRTVVIMKACDNLAEVKGREPKADVIPVPEAIPPPPQAEAPPPVAAEASLVVLPEAQALPVAPSRCPLDPKMVIGGEYEPNQGGNEAQAHFLSAALYCTWEGENGTHGVGVGVQASKWEGLVNGGAGTFKGNLLAAGPGYEYLSRDGWDVESKLLFGKLNESFVQGDYESSRSFGVWGPSLGYNNYARRLRGEKWFPETQVHGTLLFPFSRQASHSWQGKPIEDTSKLSEFKSYLSVGARQWLYDGEVLHPYVQLGYFKENPTAESASFRVGIADPNHMCGIGIGLDYDLISGGYAKALGGWCDVVKGAKVLRTKHRQSQVKEEIRQATGRDVTMVQGIAMVPIVSSGDAETAADVQPVGEPIPLNSPLNANPPVQNETAEPDRFAVGENDESSEGDESGGEFLSSEPWDPDPNPVS